MSDDINSIQLDLPKHPERPIRSFVLRQGRFTQAQQQAFEQLWPQMGIDFSPQLIKASEIFGREAETVLEIGFGMGHSLVQTASDNPQQNFIGVEVHLPGVGACLAAARQAGLTNLRIIHHDAVEVLKQMIPVNSLDRIQIFFPDPWHKARHNKRRIIQMPFVELIAAKLKLGGIVHLATDWQDYAEHMLSVMNEARGYHNLSVNNDYIPRPEFRPLTKFEQRGQRLGHGVWDLMFQRVEKSVS